MAVSKRLVVVPAEVFRRDRGTEATSHVDKLEKLKRSGTQPIMDWIKRVLITALLGLSTVFSQASQTVATNTAATASVTNASVIPLTELAGQAESAEAVIRAIQADIEADHTIPNIEENLTNLTTDIDTRLEEDSRLLGATPALHDLRRMEDNWQRFQEELKGWKRDLGKRGQELTSEIGHLTELNTLWSVTQNSARTSNVPAEVLERISLVVSNLQATLQPASDQQSLVLKLQNRVTQQDARVEQGLSTLAHARRDAFNGLLSQDSPPFWSPKFWSGNGETMASEGHRSFARQARALKAYLSRMRERLLIHAALFLVTGALLTVGRWRLRKTLLADASVKHAVAIFESPFATAFLLCFLASGWLYPGPPRLFRAILGAATIFPAAIVLGRLVPRALFSILYGLILLYLADQLLLLTASLAVLSRVLFLGEMIGAALFTAYILRLMASLSSTVTRKREWFFTRATIWIALTALAVAVLATALGYGGLGKVIGQIMLTSAYLGLVLYAAIRILDGLLHTALSVPPLAGLGLIRHHRAFLQNRAWRLMQWIALLFWASFMLETISLRAPLFQDFKEISKASIGFGTHVVSVGDLVLFIVAVWLAFTVSKICRFVLEEEVYPRVHLAPGLHYSINTVIHYTILMVGFFAGVGLLGYDLSKLTILAGAFSVGLGFGLQNVINNFVSGIILLFERPIKIGDVIQIDSTEGVVERIGIRASVVRAINGSAIIMPNGKLISDPVVNWTFSHRQRLIVLPITVAAGADPKQIAELLTRVALEHPLVVKDPPPQALVTDIAGGKLRFEIRAATNTAEDWPKIRSELATALYSELARQQIVIV